MQILCKLEQSHLKGKSPLPEGKLYVCPTLKLLLRHVFVLFSYELRAFEFDDVTLQCYIILSAI